MSSQYVTEPPPTATVLLHTTAGPLTVSLFAQQTPLTSRNFLQLCLDGYYDGTIFHRVAPGFVIQTGDPTGTGEGGQSIYEDREFERYDKDWANVLKRDVEGEKIVFGDEIHTRLKFNRRGLVGLAKGTGQDGGYGSQFFITLGDCRAELDGKCTMFGRVEGDGIYNVVKISEGECVEGTERPMYPEKILRVEVLDLPKGAAWEKMSKRARVAARTTEEDKPKKKLLAKKKGGKALLSFGGDEGDESENMVVRPKKAKFNTALINSSNTTISSPTEDKPRPPPNGPLSGNKAASPSRRSPSLQQRPLKRKADSTSSITKDEPAPKRRTPSPSPKRRKPSFHDSTTQLPLRDPESPSHSPSDETSSPPPSHRRTSSTTKKTTSALEAEIAALKQSMRRGGDTNTSSTNSRSNPRSAIEAFIPPTSTRGRKRPRPGESNDKEDRTALKLLDAFRARLENADVAATNGATTKKNGMTNSTKTKPTFRSKSKSKSKYDAGPGSLSNDDNEDEEARLCDLHFIANCQSCFAAEHAERSNDHNGNDEMDDDDDDDDDGRGFLGHALTFEKDRLGKDLTWKKKSEEELVVIDPRERERELGLGKGKKRDRERERIGGTGKEREREKSGRGR